MQFRYTNDSANSLIVVSLRGIQEAGQIFCLLSILIFRFHLVSNKNDWNNWNLLYLLALVYTSDGSDRSGLVSGVGIGRKFRSSVNQHDGSGIVSLAFSVSLAFIC